MIHNHPDPVQVEYADLLQALNNACDEMGLQALDSFVAKCIQLYETSLVRHGLMLVGPTMGGKTACYNALQKVRRVILIQVFCLQSAPYCRYTSHMVTCTLTASQPWHCMGCLPFTS